MVHEIPAEWLPVRWNEVAVRSHVACRRNLITGLTSAASPRVYISSSCKFGQKLGEILYPLICFFMPCLSCLLRSQFPKSWRDLWITLYNIPEDILHGRTEQSLMQIEKASIVRNSLSPQRGILKQNISHVSPANPHCFPLKRNYVT